MTRAGDDPIEQLRALADRPWGEWQDFADRTHEALAVWSTAEGPVADQVRRELRLHLQMVALGLHPFTGERLKVREAHAQRGARADDDPRQPWL